MPHDIPLKALNKGSIIIPYKMDIFDLHPHVPLVKPPKRHLIIFKK